MSGRTIDDWGDWGAAGRQASAHVRQVRAFIKHTRRTRRRMRSTCFNNSLALFPFLPVDQCAPPPTATVPVSEVRLYTKNTFNDQLFFTKIVETHKIKRKNTIITKITFTISVTNPLHLSINVIGLDQLNKKWKVTISTKNCLIEYRIWLELYKPLYSRHATCANDNMQHCDIIY